jgi:ribosomal protein S18 acetylase RimI-like enzyme
VAEIVVELLTKAHDRKSFDCGRQAQNSFLKERARKHAELNFSKTWVAVRERETAILGYVSLSMGSVAFEQVTHEIRARLPKYPMPVLHVAQLATDKHYQGKGVGPFLLRFAAEQAISISKSVGCFALELEADNEKARAFYQKHGFLELMPGAARLYQTVETLEKALLTSQST